MVVRLVGDEFIVNTTSVTNQANPSVTALSDGRFVVTWFSGDGGDGSESAIRGRILNADGSASTDDFIVNTTTFNFQDDPSVTALPDGRFVVTWQSDDGLGTGTDIRGRIFNADGTATADDFVVNTTTLFNQGSPSVTVLPDGRFVVTWGSNDGGDGSATAVRGRIFNADGTASAADFIVNTTTVGWQGGPSVTALADDRFVVTWVSDAVGDGREVIRGRILNADGTASADDFIVNTTTVNRQLDPSVTALPDGRFVVTWVSFGGDGSGEAIRGRIFNADGSTSADDFIVNTTTFLDQVDPCVTALPDGRFVVTWVSGDGGDGSGTAIRGRILNADGSTSADDFIVNTTTVGYQYRPSVATLPDGRFVVTWDSYDGESTIRGVVLSPQPNQAPTITSDGGQDTAAVSVPENSIAVTTVSATDGDAGQALVFSIAGGADADKFQIDASTGSLRFVAAPDFEDPADVGADNVYDVTVQVSDGIAADSQAIRVSIDSRTQFTLTANADTFIGTSADETVKGNSATLTAGDILDGGTGHDVLQLFGDGLVDLSALELFRGFEEVTVTNVTGGRSDLKLGSAVDLTVNIDNETGQGGTVRLADGATTLHLGSSTNYAVLASSGAVTIDGDGFSNSINLSTGDADVDIGGRSNFINLSTGNANITQHGSGGIVKLSTGTAHVTDTGAGNTYQVSTGLTTLDLSGSFGGNVQIFHVSAIDYNDIFIGSTIGVSTLFVDGSHEELDLTRLNLVNSWALNVGEVFGSSSVTLDVDQTSLSHLRSIVGANHEMLRTSEATLDLTQTPVSGGITIASTNAAGTTFTLSDIDTGLRVIGGAGNDTLVAQGFAFTSSQRAAIFTQGSIETIQDASGTYQNPIMNSAPTIISNGGGDTAAMSLAENATDVTIVDATDPDGGKSLSFSIAGGADAGLFSVDGTTGALSFATASDFENPTDEDHNNVYDVTVQVSDGAGGIDTQAMSVTITDINEPPVITSVPATGAVQEDVITLQATHQTQATGTLVAIDPDAGTDLTWSVVGGSTPQPAAYHVAMDNFSVVRNGATLINDTFSNGLPPPSGSGTLTYSVNGAVFSETGDRLIMGDDGFAKVGSLSPNDSIVGQVATLLTNIDPATPTQGLRSTTDFTVAGRFDLTIPDSARDTYGIALTGNDVLQLVVRGGVDGVARVQFREVDFVNHTVTIIDAIAPTPPAGADQIVLKLDHSATNVGVIHASFDYLSGGLVVGSQTFGGTGQIFGTEPGSPGNTSGVGSWTRAQIIAFAPEASDSQLQGTYGTLDVDQTGAWTYTLANGQANVQALAAGETVSEQFTVQVSDGLGGSDTETISVAVFGSNDAPTDILLSANTVAENAVAGTVVGNLSALDEDNGATVAFSLIDDAGGRFALSGNQLVVGNGALLDFEQAQSHQITLRADDGLGGTFDETLTIAITNVAENRAPVISSDGAGDTAAVTVAENTSAVTTMSALDPDGEAPTFAIVAGADAPLFTIDSSTGALAFIEAPDFENPTDADHDNVYDVTLEVSDGAGGTDTQAIIVSVANIAGTSLSGTNAANTLTGTSEEDIFNGQGGNDTLQGLGGNDTLIGGTGADTLNGGRGNDTFTYALGNGADVVDGGGELDTLSIAGLLGNDTLDVLFDGAALTKFEGGTITSVEAVTADLLTGTNTLSYAGTAAPVSVLVNLANATASGFSSIANISNVTGGNGADVLTGSDGDNVLNGGAGDDVLSGGLGSDALSGGGGFDAASFATETDAMFVDLVAGTARRGSAAAPVEDTLAAIENVIGGSGDDDFSGNGGANSIEGGAGKDTLAGFGGADALFGGLGDDTLIGGAGNDAMSGGDGNDSFTYAFGDGADTVDGGLGSDTLNVTGTAANETLDVIFDGTSLTNFEGGAVVGVENIQADLLGGTDTLTYAGTTATVIVDLAAGAASGFTSIAGIENAVGGSGNDILTGGVGTNTLTGGAGNDTFVVNDTTDVVSEANGVVGGIDTVNSIANTYTIADADVENLTYIGGGNFTGTGNGSNNLISGGAGLDTLSGAGGNDTLIGGAGNDAMNGGAGNDMFVFGSSFGNDTISGFDANPIDGQDLLDLTALGITVDTFAATVAITDLGPDTLITIGTDTITLKGVNGVGTNAISQQDFLLS